MISYGLFLALVEEVVQSLDSDPENVLCLTDPIHLLRYKKILDF